jgi:formate dehydrogenase major subunit
VPDFPPELRPDYRPDEDADGMDAIAGDAPFIMMPDGRAHLYSASGLLDAPLPTHYEPLESPVRNELYPDVHANPVGLTWSRAENPLAEDEDGRWPHVASTFRLTEHHTAGPMSRNLPWLAELQPEMFAEIDPELAAEAGIEDGGWMVIETPRAEIEARAKVTSRVRPLQVGGRRLHQVCMPWHFGTFASNEQGAVGDSANDLVAITGDPNVSIQESKAFRCNVRAGRRDEETTERLAGIDSTPEAADPGASHPAEQPTREGQHYRYGVENREL